MAKDGKDKGKGGRKGTTGPAAAPAGGGLVDRLTGLVAVLFVVTSLVGTVVH